MNDRKLILVGTVHIDRYGESKLEKAIQAYQPCQITFELEEGTSYTGNTLEWCATEIKYICSLSGLSMSRAQRTHAAQQMAQYGFEARVAEKMRQTKPVHLVDLPGLIDGPASRIDPPSLEMLYFRQKAGVLYREIARCDPELISYGYAELAVEAIILAKTGKPVRKRLLDEWYDIGSGWSDKSTQRDEYMCMRIAEIWRSSSGSMMHVGGLAHLFCQGTDLYSMLKEELKIEPMRINLNVFR